MGGPWDLYNTYHKRFFDDGQYVGMPDILIGHNRHATQGKIDKEGAHPFLFSNIIGAHNGTVFQSYLKDFHEAKKYDIDSQIIFSQINHDPNLQYVWSNAKGAMALVWWDKRDSCMHFVRNKERSLFYTMDDKQTRIYWASEKWMLEVALSKNQQTYTEIKPFEVDTHYKVDMLPHKLEIQEEKLEPPVILVYQGNNYKSWGCGGTGDGEGGFFHTKKDKDYQYLKFYIKEMQDSEYGPFFWGISSQSLSVLVNVPDKDEKNYEEEVKKIKDVPTTELWAVKWEETEWKQMGGNLSCFLVESVNIKKYSELESSKVVDIHKNFNETKGFKGEKLLKTVFEERLKEGCSNCLEVIEWKDRFKMRWIDDNHAYCPSCVTLPSIKQELQRIYGGEKKNA